MFVAVPRGKGDLGRRLDVLLPTTYNPRAEAARRLVLWGTPYKEINCER
jgi:hypothetical protein